MSKEIWQQENGSVSKTERPSLSARELFDKSVAICESSWLGQIVTRNDIKSLAHSPEGNLVRAEFKVLPEYKTQYPDVVIKALGNLYAEYNKAFDPLVAANREWETDYQYCFAPDGTPINGWVQIDMVGLPDSFLKKASFFDETQIREALRGRIFEIENSLAMYQLLERIFSYGGQDTLFKKQFRTSLNDLRRRTGRPIALLAVTEQKYQEMRRSEFGKNEGELLTDEEVRELSGFDKFFGPYEFEQYLMENNGECDYLLYARTSYPLAKLKQPNTEVSIPLLENPYTRRIIRAHAVTFNIDDPQWPNGDPRKINDTKAWMSSVGMALDVYNYTDIVTEEERRDDRGKLRKVFVPTERLIAFLQQQGIAVSGEDPKEIALHAKPMQASYGCYGHTRGPLKDSEFRRELRKGLHERGPYVLQPEMQIPLITNTLDGQTYTYIDRNFMWTNGEDYHWMGGFRSLIPIDSIESKKGRNHGSIYTVWAEIK